MTDDDESADWLGDDRPPSAPAPWDPIAHRRCADCGHVHASDLFNRMCIGCPCPNRPGMADE